MGDGLRGDQHDTNWVSIGIGIGGSTQYTFNNMQDQGYTMIQSYMSDVKGTPQPPNLRDQ